VQDIIPIVQDGVAGYLTRAHGRIRTPIATERNMRRDKCNGWRFIPRIAGGAVATAQQPAMAAALPFVASAHEHVEPAFTLTSALGAATVPFNPQDIPAYGYLRSIFLEVSVAGPSAGTIAADGPWNILSSVVMQDVNGANIVGPIDGYALYIANLLGGYANRSNPQDSPLYSITTPYLPTFGIRVPVEVSRQDGFGSLANQNASANYKLSLTLNTSLAAFPTLTGTATVTIRAWLEAWTLPAPVSNQGIPQAQAPPLLGSGQYWSSRTQSVLVGSNTVGLTRVGNYIRAIGFIGRDASNVRTNASLPDPFQFNWDGMSIVNTSQNYMRQKLYEGTNGVVTLPTGVLALLYDTGGAAGDIGNDPSTLWLPTMQSSRLEIAGTWAGAGSMQVLTNEIAPVDADQATRFQVPNGSGAYAANVPPTTQAA
jgi:hypothetical protein